MRYGIHQYPMTLHHLLREWTTRGHDSPLCNCLNHLLCLPRLKKSLFKTTFKCLLSFFPFHLELLASGRAVADLPFWIILDRQNGSRYSSGRSSGQTLKARLKEYSEMTVACLGTGLYQQGASAAPKLDVKCHWFKRELNQSDHRLAIFRDATSMEVIRLTLKELHNCWKIRHPFLICFHISSLNVTVKTTLSSDSFFSLCIHLFLNERLYNTCSIFDFCVFSPVFINLTWHNPCSVFDLDFFPPSFINLRWHNTCSVFDFYLFYFTV